MTLSLRISGVCKDSLSMPLPNSELTFQTCPWASKTPPKTPEKHHKHWVPVVPHKAVAEVSKKENYRRDWLL